MRHFVFSFGSIFPIARTKTEINFQKLLVNNFDEEKILVSLIDSLNKNHRRYFFLFHLFLVKLNIRPVNDHSTERFLAK